MLINRKRSYRRGPTYRQTYVPHDQRQINTQPTPIMDEKTAQYYLNQLSQMGYIPSPVTPQPPYIVTIKHQDPDGQVTFDIKQDLSLGTGGTISSDNMQVIDIYGNPYSNPLITNENILNRVGVKLYPIIANGGLGVYNATASQHSIHWIDTEDFMGTSRSDSVASHSFFYFPNGYFTKALISANGNEMHYTAYQKYYDDGLMDVMYCDDSDFYLVCKELTVMVYPA